MNKMNDNNKKIKRIDYKLRNYQQNQYNFIDNRIDIADVVAIESGTGSGKTITFLSFVYDWLSRSENHLSNVVITTGFNNLVFLLEKRCKEFGLNAKVLIGTKACNCPVEMEEAGLKDTPVFTETDKYRCGNKHKHLDVSTDNWGEKVCPFTQELYRQYFKEIKESVGQVIIMNHSSFLVHQENIPNVSLLVIDEAHTFADFYDSYLRLELDKNDLKNIDESITNLKPPMNMIIKMNMQKGVQLPSQQIDAICDNMKNKNSARIAREFFETKPDYSNYIERGKDFYTVDHFYRQFELKIKPKTLLFSATMDKFTQSMFGLRESNLYRERKMFCDYSLSEFIAIPDDNFERALIKFLDYVDEEKNLKSGLILSTTIVDMNLALKHDGYRGYKMFTNREEFENYGENSSNTGIKKILVGSRSLFQGVDIKGLKFVCMNKLPFPLYDDKARALQEYLTNHGKNDYDSWNSYVVPKTENDIIQGTGRLWRGVTDSGVVSIFDSRCEKRFKYMMRHVFDIYRHGINTKIMHEDENGNISIEKFDINKESSKY